MTFRDTTASKAFGNISYQTPDSFSPEVQQIVQNLRRLVNAETAKEHHEALEFLDEHFIWDAPPIYMEGRDKARVVMYLAKLFASLDFDPQEVAITSPASGRAGVRVKLYNIFKVHPKRAWYQLWSFLLPNVFNIESTIELELNDRDKVSKLTGRIHNWPTLPVFMRYIPSFFMGQVGLWTEPLWGQFIHFLNGDTSYQQFMAPRQMMGASQMGWGTESYGAGQQGYTSGQPGYTSGQQGYTSGGQQAGWTSGAEKVHEKGHKAGHHQGYTSGGQQAGYTTGQQGYSTVGGETQAQMSGRTAGLAQ